MLKAIGLATLALLFVSLMAERAAAVEATITKGGLFCVDYAGIQSAVVSMNERQLQSLGCIAVRHDTPVSVIDDFNQRSIYRRVDVTLPDSVVQGYAHDAIGNEPGLVRRP